ncbi:MAG: SDR family NAD(P)-dependent oxidoreductase [Lachnospira sp.]|nr:SDR family NAD(P)-dependent oxidoreductase [Lachnospira sp.]
MSTNIIVTGASRGIGKAIAETLAKPDINLVINCVNNSGLLDSVADSIRKKGASCTTFIGDISDYNTAANMFDVLHNTYGHADILINNAGISMVGLFQDMPRTDWERIMNVNVGSVYNCCHFAIPDMVSGHSGKIINISSVWGNVGASCEVAYSASKGAINSLTKALAKELAPSNIQVNAVSCGAIDTDMNSVFTENELNALCEEIPAGRLGSPLEVANIVNYLCSAPEYLTGQIITMDGSWI